MIRERRLIEADREALQQAIAQDDTHPDTKPDFYFEPGTLGVVYEDDYGPVIYGRFSSVLQINLQFFHGASKRRIMEVMGSQFPLVRERATLNGYKKITFQSVNPRLRAFCRRYLRFKPSPDEHVLWL